MYQGADDKLVTKVAAPKPPEAIPALIDVMSRLNLCWMMGEIGTTPQPQIHALAG